MSDILTATITLVNGTEMYFGNDAIASGSWSFKKTAGSGGFEMGGAAISSCNFTIIDSVGAYNGVNFENADVVANINGEPYWKGYIKTATQAYNKIVVTAYDKLAIADERKMSMYSSTGEPNISRSDLATFIATDSQFGIGLSGISGLANGSGIIPKIDKDCTFRQAIAYIAEAGGQFAYVDTVNNVLCFAWYDFTNQYVPATIFGRNLSRDSTMISYVNIISYDGAAAQMEPTFGSDGLTVEVSGNPCVTSDTLSGDVAAIKSALVGVEFIAGTLTVGTDMELALGKTVPISHHGRTYHLPVASITYKPNNTMVIGCNDVNNMKMSFKSGSTMTSTGSDYRKTSYQQALDDAITNRNSKLAQALAQGGGEPTGGANILVIKTNTYIVGGEGSGAPLSSITGRIMLAKGENVTDEGIPRVETFTITKIWTGMEAQQFYIPQTRLPYMYAIKAEIDGTISNISEKVKGKQCVMVFVGKIKSTGDYLSLDNLMYVYIKLPIAYHPFAIANLGDDSGTGTDRLIPITYKVATVNHVSAGTGTTVTSTGAVSVNTETDSDVDDAIDGILIS